jgi:hypothetical protein
MTGSGRWDKQPFPEQEKGRMAFVLLSLTERKKRGRRRLV